MCGGLSGAPPSWLCLQWCTHQQGGLPAAEALAGRWLGRRGGQCTHARCTLSEPPPLLQAELLAAAAGRADSYAGVAQAGVAEQATSSGRPAAEHAAALASADMPGAAAAEGGGASSSGAGVEADGWQQVKGAGQSSSQAERVKAEAMCVLCSWRCGACATRCAAATSALVRPHTTELPLGPAQLFCPRACASGQVAVQGGTLKGACLLPFSKHLLPAGEPGVQRWRWKGSKVSAPWLCVCPACTACLASGPSKLHTLARCREFARRGRHYGQLAKECRTAVNVEVRSRAGLCMVCKLTQGQLTLLLTPCGPPPPLAGLPVLQLWHLQHGCVTAQPPGALCAAI